MDQQHLGLDVEARQRHARLLMIGDRRAPTAKTPALVRLDGDMELPVSLAPFSCMREGTSLPARFTFLGRGPLCPPFQATGPNWSLELGQVLPPSLDEAEVGDRGSSTPVLCLSLERMRHDAALPDIEQPAIVVLSDAVQLAHRTDSLPQALLTIRCAYPAALIWCPGLSGPDNLALLTWFGVDLHDMGRSRQARAAELLLTSSGPRPADSELEQSTDDAAQLAAWMNEMAEVRAALRGSRLRELVEKRALNSARFIEHLRHHDLMVAQSPRQALCANVHRDRVLRCHSSLIRTDPLIREWPQRIAKEYTPDASRQKLLILLPCSARKPYRVSRSHKRFRHAIGYTTACEVSITSPLGLVPRELEELWPVCHYDIPVTGDWDAEELSIVQGALKGLLQRIGFERIINHSGIDISSFYEGIEVVDTRGDSKATSSEALARLSAALTTAKEDLGLSEERGRVRRRIEYATISRWLFGSDAWMKGCNLAGRPPHFRIEKNGGPFAQWNHISAGFSFTKAALPVLAEHGTLPTADITLPHDWTGDVFGPMVLRADASIRAGEIVLLHSDGRLVASAVAQAPGWEWEGGCGRLAKVRHRLKG